MGSMNGVERIDGGPRSAVVVGAGIVGLSTAWFLQERGVEVTVVDRRGVAAGASWGNAGWISPTLTIPLNDPAVLRYGLRSLFDPAAPLHIPLNSGPRVLAFLTRFAMNCRLSTWTRAAKANVPFNEECPRGLRRPDRQRSVGTHHRRTDHGAVRNAAAGRTSDDRTAPDGRGRSDRDGDRPVR